MSKILVVDDDAKIVTLVKLYLEQERHQVLMAHDGLKGLTLARQEKPDLIVLDLMLPGLDGLDVCRLLMSEMDVPIIMLTAKRTEDDRLIGLELGADDYVTKPFSPRELVLRVRAVLRRLGKQKGNIPELVQVGDLVVDYGRKEVKVRGRSVTLTPKEFGLLAVLAESPGRVFSRQELLELVFGFAYQGVDRTVDTHIMNLRRKIEPDPNEPVYVQTVYGQGYRLAEMGRLRD
jgi:DNA-binding response OmpR family regulator